MKIYLGLVCLLAATLTAIAGWGLHVHREPSSAVTLVPSETGLQILPLPVDQQQNLDSAPPVLSPDIVRASLRVVVKWIDPQTRTADLDITVSVPTQLASELPEGHFGSGGYVPEGLHLRVATAAPPNEQSVTAPGSDSPSTSVERSLDPGEFDTAGNAGQEPVIAVHLQGIPLTGATPSDYPFDSYRARIVFQILSDQPVPLGPDPSLATVRVTSLPLKTTVRIAPGLDDFTSTVAVSPTTAYPSTAGAWQDVTKKEAVTTSVMDVEISRSREDQVIAMAVGSVALVLALLFVQIGLLGGGRQSNGDSSLNFIVGVAASMLAILPLRNVLIPGTIQARTFTTLDLYLALQVALLALIAALYRLKVD